MATGATLMGRKQAEALMESTCTIARDNQVLDTATGLYANTPTTIYSGKCRVKYSFARVTELGAVGQALAEQRPELSIPVNGTGSGAVLVDDVVTITTNPLDTSLVGGTFRIAGVHAQTHATARRFPIVVLS